MKFDVKRRHNSRAVDRKSLRKCLSQFIKTTPGFNKKSYGEILFKDFGTRTTFSAFVTCNPSTDPEDVWRLLLEFWNLSVPNIVVSIAGNFNKYDAEWKGIMDNTWLVTGGTAPSKATSYACSIAIMSIGSVADNGALFSISTDGVFPAVYRADKVCGSQGKKLDFAHTHFIFVQGDTWQTLEFREKLLQYIAAIPIEMDATFTEFITTPVVVAMVSEEPTALVHLTGDIAKKYPVIVSKSALNFNRMLTELAVAKELSQDKSQAILTSDAEAKLHVICKCLPEEELDAPRVENTLKEHLFMRNDVIHYPSPNNPRLDLAILHGTIKNSKSSFRSQIRLALAWNRMDVIKRLVPSRDVFEKEEEAYTVYLVMALMLDRSEFLEYLNELGIRLWRALTVKTLWIMYFKPLFKEGFETRISHTLHSIVCGYSDSKTHLLRCVGKAINSLTHHEVSCLYNDGIYQYFDAAEITDLNKRTTTTVLTQIDETSLVPHPERDLFLWAMLMGKNDLARLFWKGGYSLMASSIIASAVAKSQGVMLDNTLEGSDLAESLYETAQEWEDTAIEFLTTSFKANRSTTLCQVTQKIEILGGCSVLQLAYTCKHREFIAHPAVQTALDYIWYGMTKQEQPLWKVLITLVCPVAVPCLNVIERKDVFTTAMSHTYRSLYTDGETEIELGEQAQTGIGGMLNVIEKWGGNPVNEGIEVVHHNKAQTHLVSAMRDTYDYFNSPRVKFLVHAMFLTITITLLSYYLLTEKVRGNQTDTTSFIISIVLCSYFLGIAVDEMRQLGNIESATTWGKMKAWIGSPWNQMDLCLVTCYLVGQIIMWCGAYNDNLWYCAKGLLCISLFAMYIRCFQVYLVFKYFGPKVYMMRRMLKDLVIFFSIMGLIFLCYGVILTAMESEPDNITQHINGSTPDSFILSAYNHIIRRPYWQLYGNSLNNASEAQSSYYGLVRALLTCFYMLFSNILMLNLLIAMFSYTFTDIQDRAGIFWSFHRFDVVEEFCDRPWLPSPFVVFEDIARFINICRDGPVTYSAFCKPVSNEQEIELFSFEQDVLEVMTEEADEKEKDRNLLRAVSEMQKEIQVKLEHVHNLEMSRLALTRMKPGSKFGAAVSAVKE